MGKPFSLSISSITVRTHLFILVLLSSLPFFTIIVFSTLDQFKEKHDETGREAMNLIMNISSSQESLTSGVQQLLKTISLLDDVEHKRVENLNELLASLLASNPQYGNILVADRDGNVFASGRPFTPPLSIADRRFYNDAIRTKKFSPGEYIIGKTALKPLINFGYPVLAGDGSVTAIIAAGIDLEYVQKLFSSSALPEGSTAGILDWKGIILHRLRDSHKYTGKPGVSENFRRMREGPVEGSFMSTGVDGIGKILFYRKLFIEGSAEPYLYIIVSIPDLYLHTKIKSAMINYISLFGGIFVIVMCIAFLVSKYTITDRVRHLLEIIRAFDGSGSDIEEEKVMSGEFDILSKAFDDMRKNLERRQIEKDRALEELKYRNILLSTQQEASTDGILALAVDSAIISLNRRFLEMWGIDTELSVADRGEQAFMMIFDRLLCAEGFQDQVKSLSVNIEEKSHAELVLKNGRIFDCDSSPIISLDGSFYGRLWNFRDITERKQSDDALRESEDKFSRAFQNAPVWFSLTELDNGTFIDVNEEAVRLSGFRREEFLGRRFVDIGWISRNNYALLVEELFSKGRISNIEMTFRTKDGRLLFGLVSGERIIVSGRECLLVAIVDITRRKKAEAEAVAEKERFLVMLRSIAEGVISTDLDGRIILMNRVAEDLTGWNSYDTDGKMLEDIFITVQENSRTQCKNTLTRIIETGEPGETEKPVILISRDGSERIIEESGAPIRDSENRIIGGILVFRDITNRQKTENALHNAQKLESLSILAGGIAHDFNNLLGGIFGFLEIALESIREKDTSSAFSAITEAITVFERARDLTRQLLTFAKGGAPIKTAGSVAELVRDSVQFALAGSNISSSFRIQEDLWLCNIDKNQIAQVIDNISINARQAMAISGGVFEVDVSNVPARDVPPILAGKSHIRISLRDSGPGISRDNLHHIFDPFFTTKEKGSGLGLATCYSIVKRHDGLIEVESETGKGTVFHIWLPATDEKTYNKPSMKKKNYNGVGRILVMDDEPALTSVISSILDKLGFSVDIAKRGEDAIDIARKAFENGNRFSVAILDLTIPGGLGGKDTARHLLSIDPDIKLVASSGYSGDSILSNPEAYGFKASIAKPFKMNELAEILASVLA